MFPKLAIVITRTRWGEPPRLRHQVAKLLASNSINVIFLEKSNILGLRHLFSFRKKNNGISCLPLVELIHHQLCISPILSLFSNVFTIIQLFYLRSLSAEPPLIVNFNYDFWFIRHFFRKSRIVTILNDDFQLVSKIKLFNHAHIRITKTCSISTQVLALSPQILASLPIDSRYKLFTPWSPSVNTPFPPIGHNLRNRLVYWGYINDRLSIDTVLYLLDNHQSLLITFIGPVEPSFKNCIDNLLEYPNFSWRSSCNLSEINTNDLLAFFIPYDIAHPITKTLYLPNKFLQLLSLGFPLLVPDLLDLKKHDSLLRYNPSDLKSISTIINSLDVDLLSNLRHFILQLLSAHSESSAFQDIVGESNLTP